MTCLILILLWLDTTSILPVTSTQPFYPSSIFTTKASSINFLLTNLLVLIGCSWISEDSPMVLYSSSDPSPAGRWLMSDACWGWTQVAFRLDFPPDSAVVCVVWWPFHFMPCQCPLPLVQFIPCSHNAHLADGAHGSHVALIPGAELRWREQARRVKAVQASVDGDLTYGPQVTMTPDLEFGGVFIGNPGREQRKRCI